MEHITVTGPERAEKGKWTGARACEEGGGVGKGQIYKHKLPGRTLVLRPSGIYRCVTCRLFSSPNIFSVIRSQHINTLGRLTRPLSLNEKQLMRELPSWIVTRRPSDRTCCISESRSTLGEGLDMITLYASLHFRVARPGCPDVPDRATSFPAHPLAYQRLISTEREQINLPSTEETLARNQEIGHQEIGC